MNGDFFPQTTNQVAQQPQPALTIDEELDYKLEVVQQPVVARMCGFGDKDRRPITPEPCVRLIVRDKNRKEVDIKEIDTTFLILNVDLWNAECNQEVNLVYDRSASSFISAPSMVSFQPSAQSQMGAYDPYMGPVLPEPVGHGFYYSNNSAFPYEQQPGQPYSGANPGPGVFPQPPMAPQIQRRAQGTATRNLVGSVCVSALRLRDTVGRMGIWFVLPHLSVRTEGTYCLRMSLVNVGMSLRFPDVSWGSPVLATALSDPFDVFTAKYFTANGLRIAKSTSLSRCFAEQGVKITIRKEKANSAGNEQDSEDQN